MHSFLPCAFVAKFAATPSRLEASDTAGWKPALQVTAADQFVSALCIRRKICRNAQPAGSQRHSRLETCATGHRW